MVGAWARARELGGAGTAGEVSTILQRLLFSFQNVLCVQAHRSLYAQEHSGRARRPHHEVQTHSRPHALPRETMASLANA